MKKISEIKKLNLESLLTIFFNVVDYDNEKYIIKSSYRSSTHAKNLLDEEYCLINNELMNNYTELQFEKKRIGTHKAYLKNDENIEFIDLMKKIYALIQQKRFDYEEEDFDRKVINCAFALRGSVDLTAGYMALDIYESLITEEYVDLLMNLLISTSAVDQLNLNFRKLQKQYVDGIHKRNTQIRINLRWFYVNCLDELEKLNKYKAEILRDSKNRIELINYTKHNSSFLERMLFYKEKIINPSFSFDKLSKEELDQKVKELRKELEFNVTEESNTERIRRNKQIVTTASVILPDECVSCKDYYKTTDRTFKRRNSERYYFELHHVISFGSKQSGDILENLVKLCPACHRALTPNRADEKYQKQIIKDILYNSKEANNYVGNFVKNPNIMEDKVNYVYSNLK